MFRFGAECDESNIIRKMLQAKQNAPIIEQQDTKQLLRARKSETVLVRGTTLSIICMMQNML